MSTLVEQYKRITSDQYYTRISRYILIGGITTFISFGTFWLLGYRANVNFNTANSISVFCAVAFAYVANKTFVFRSRCNSILELVLEIILFFISRAFAMLVEIAGLFLLHTHLQVDAMLSKIAVSTTVLVLNYLLQKLIVFRHAQLRRRRIFQKPL